MDLETAMEKILELTDENKALKDQITSYEIKREEYESKLEEGASEVSRLKELNMKYFTRLTMEQNDALGHEVQSEQSTVEEQTEVPSYDDLLKDWS